MFGWFGGFFGVWWGVCGAVGCRLWVLVVLAAGCGRVWFDGWVPSVWDGSGLVYGGARVGVGLVGCGGGVADGVVLGVVWSGRAGVLLLWLSRLRVRRVCSRLWMTAAMSGFQGGSVTVQKTDGRVLSSQMVVRRYSGPERSRT